MPAAWKGELGDRELIAFDWCHERWWIGDHPSFLILHSLCKTGLNLDSNGLSAVLCLHRIEPLWDHCEPRVILPRKCNVTPRGLGGYDHLLSCRAHLDPGPCAARCESTECKEPGRGSLASEWTDWLRVFEHRGQNQNGKVKSQTTANVPISSLR